MLARVLLILLGAYRVRNSDSAAWHDTCYSRLARFMLFGASPRLLARFMLLRLVASIAEIGTFPASRIRRLALQFGTIPAAVQQFWDNWRILDHPST